MKVTDLGFVALRILGLILALMGLMGAVSAVSFFGLGDMGEAGTRWIGRVQVLAYLAVLVFGFYLFVYSRKASEYLFSSMEDSGSRASTSSIQAVGFSIVGVVIAAQSLPALGTTLAQFVWVLRAGADLERQGFLGSGTLYDVLYNVLALGIGVFLFVRGSWLAGFWDGLHDDGDEV